MSESSMLMNFGVDLIELALKNKLDPVIGRKAEINRLIQILSRRTKNNPMVLGEPGVGKTAIIEGLAQRIARHHVPRILVNKRIVTLDLAAVLAGTKYRGEFERRMKAIIKEVIDFGDIILFIDEIHTMMGAGASESSLDASSMLKPQLSRGEVQVIGATTLDEYRKRIEKDGAMERRFQPLIVEPSTFDETIAILRGLKERYEAHHRVRITDQAIESAVMLSNRYISGRFFPDKAIDVMDEAASRVCLKMIEKCPESFSDLAKAHEEISELRKQYHQAHREDLPAAEEIRKHLSTKVAQAREVLMTQKVSGLEFDGIVDEATVAETVVGITGISIANILESDNDRLQRFEKEIRKMYVGQNHAVVKIAQTLRRAHTGLKDPNRPLGSFLFVGPSGVGKTLLAKALAKFLFGLENALIQIDMSEYMERHNISRLMGSPPGYVGYEEGGQFTEKVRRKPYSVILFDEIEKAHADYTNILLQILEEGRLTDSFGRIIDFRNTIVIMTSNIGAHVYTESHLQAGFKTEYHKEEVQAHVIEEVWKHFRQEFLNRVDDIIVFNLPTPADREQIFRLELQKVNSRLSQKNIVIEVTPDAERYLIHVGYSDRTGVRGIRRVIEEKIENPVAELILSGELKRESSIIVGIKSGRLNFSVSAREKVLDH